VLLDSAHVTTQGEGGIDEKVRDRFFPKVHDGVFVDVGAGRPDFLSMSALYRQLGWHVIAIEPNPVFCDAHRAAGHEVLQYACADRDENGVPFEVVDSHGQPYADGRVSFESFSALAVKSAYRALRPDLDVDRIVVDVRKLDTLLAEHAPDVGPVEILSVDVEGWELEVLAGFSFERYMPSVLIIENLFNDARYQRVLGEQGYVLWRRVAPNDVYVDPSRLSRAERALAHVRHWRSMIEASLRPHRGSNVRRI
jgi:FkbM family methyltransferase